MSTIPDFIWKDFSDKELSNFLGEFIQKPWLLVELDEATKDRFYNERFAPFEITQKYYDAYHDATFFRIYLASIDDSCLSMWWRYGKMELLPYQAEEKIMEWLKRSNYFVNREGLRDFCTWVIGEPEFLSYD